jgi:hypothetical protein
MLLYSEKRARDILCATIDRLVRERPGTMVARLTRDAAVLAPAEGARLGYRFANWSTAARAVVKAMLCSESLLAPDGSAIPFGVAAHAAIVGRVSDDYEDRVEAFLLESLLRRLGDVTVHDHTALAHALFRRFDPSFSLHDLEDRVVILLARIADRVTLEGDTYVVRDLASAAHLVHA